MTYSHANITVIIPHVVGLENVELQSVHIVKVYVIGGGYISIPYKTKQSKINGYRYLRRKLGNYYNTD